MSLFYMICMKPNSPLHSHGKYILTYEPNGSRSWFLLIKETCQQYGLDHPLEILDNPPNKQKFKKLVKLKICEYWQHRFVTECSELSSLKYFDPTRASLLSPHPIWRFAGSSAYEVNKSNVVAKMLSGRYRTESLKRHWSSNSGGYCVMPTCEKTLGDLEHLLLFCPALQPSRNRLYNIWSQKLHHMGPLLDIFQRLVNGPTQEFISFLLNPSANSELLSLSQAHGQWVLDNAMYLTRTYVYTIHKEKLILIGEWAKDTCN